MIQTMAPLRLPLGGGGTDLPFYYERRGGLVVAAAIRDAVRVSLQSAAEESPRPSGRRIDTPPEALHATSACGDPWLKEALRHLNAPAGVEVQVQSDIPSGSGLGGSGALLVALAHALRLRRGERPSPRALAEEAFTVEHVLMGRPTGKQDPYVAAYGGVLELRIQPDGSTHVRRLRLARPVARALERSFLLADTGERRDASQALAEQERAGQQAQAARAMEGIHALGWEIARQLESGRPAALGALFRRHWDLKRRLTPSTSTAAAERCLELGLCAGARGGKLIGAGGGGFVLLDCGARRLVVERTLAAAGFAVRRVALEPRGSRAWVPAGPERRAA